MVTKKAIEKILSSIPDPELGISIWDLGLIYEVTVTPAGEVTILMTLTSIGCPLFSMMETPIKEKIGNVKGVTKVTIDLTFDPPWNADKMSTKAKNMLNM